MPHIHLTNIAEGAAKQNNKLTVNRCWQGRAGQGRAGQGQAGQDRTRVCLEEVIHHLGTEAGGDGGAVLQAGAAVHLYQPHVQGLVHHKVVPKQLMAVGPRLQALLQCTHKPPQPPRFTTCTLPCNPLPSCPSVPFTSVGTVWRCWHAEGALLNSCARQCLVCNVSL